MNLRFYKNEDFPALEKILRETGLIYEPIHCKEIYQKQIEHDPESILVAETPEGEVVGTTFILYNPYASFIYHVAVHPNHQGQGIGKSLMEKTGEVLKRRGTDRVFGYVEDHNQKVIDFYNKFGCKTFDKAIPIEVLLSK